MTIVKYIFAILLAVPLAVLGLYLLSQFIDRNLSPEKKHKPQEDAFEEPVRKDVQGFTIQMHATVPGIPVDDITGEYTDFDLGE